MKQKNTLLKELSPVLYIHSDCETPTERDKYVKELMHYVKIDSYGKCLNNKQLPARFHIVPKLRIILCYAFIVLA